VRFPNPVVVGARIRSHVELGVVASTPSGLQLSVNSLIEIEGVEKTGCIATTLLRLQA
jgi:acyl dehydratase